MIQKVEANPVAYCTVRAVLVLLPMGGSSIPQHQHVSQLPFLTPQMKWESYEHNLALQEHDNISGALKYKFTDTTCFLVLFSLQSNNISPGCCLLPISQLTITLLLKVESPLHLFSFTLQGDTSNNFPYGEWSAMKGFYLLLADQFILSEA